MEDEKRETGKKLRKRGPALMRKEKEMKMDEDEKGMKISMRGKLKGKKHSATFIVLKKK